MNALARSYDPRVLNPTGFGLREADTKPRGPPREEEVLACMDFLRRFGVPTKSPGTWVHSYGLKHLIEAWTKEQYVTNGATIEAAIRLGFKVVPAWDHRDTPNALIGISEHLLPETQRGHPGKIFIYTRRDGLRVISEADFLTRTAKRRGRLTPDVVRLRLHIVGVGVYENGCWVPE